MLQVSVLREERDSVIKAFKKRNLDAEELVDQAIALDENRRKLQTELDATLAESNKLSKEIGMLFKSGEAQKANLLKEKTTQLKETSKQLSDDLGRNVSELQQVLFQIPNIPHELVPPGNSDEDNEEVFREGDVPQLGDIP